MRIAVTRRVGHNHNNKPGRGNFGERFHVPKGEIMKSFFGTIAMIGLILAGSDGAGKAVYIINVLALACFIGGMVGLMREIRREE